MNRRKNWLQRGGQRKRGGIFLLSAQSGRKVSWAPWCKVKRGGFAGATLLLVDISKVKLLKGNSTSKTNRKWALGWLTDGSGVCVCVCVAPCVCFLPCECVYSLGISVPRESAETDAHLCVYIGLTLPHLPSRVTAFLVLSIKKQKNKKLCAGVWESRRLHFLTWPLHTWLSFWAPWWWPDWFR